jgi:hypothetical protein
MKKLGLLILLFSISASMYLIHAQVNDTFNIIYNHNFNDNTLGIYANKEWQRDFWYPEWSDRDVPPVIMIDANDTVNPTKVMEWSFPEGAVGPREGGGQWNVVLGQSYYEGYFSYDIMLKPGFNFVLGGKIPGLKGGPKKSGQPPEWNEGFTGSLMWKANGLVRFYSYHHDQPSQYGQAINWRNYLEPGEWHNITIRCVMNTIGKDSGNYDGILEGFFDGKLSCQRTNMRFRNINSIGIDELKIYSFFGGSGDEWAATKDEWIRVDNFVFFTYKNNVDVPRGNQPSSWDRTLILPKKSNSTRKQDEIANSPPAVQNHNFTIPDNFTNGTSVGTVIASDPNTDQQLNYSILSGNTDNTFIIDESNGEISVSSSTSLKSSDTFNLLIEVTDNGLGNLSDTGLITINIQHIDIIAANSKPIISDQEFTIKEEDILGNLAMKINALDPDSGQNLSYSITSGNQNNIFNLNQSSGILTVSDTTKLNFQKETEYVLNVQVMDDGEGYLTSSAIVSINLLAKIKTFYIDPTNENDPLENGSINHPFNSWNDVSWEEGHSYLQKRGTTTNENKINVYASNITLGSYGEGEYPVINSSASDFAIRIFEKSNVTIQNLKVVADNAISCIYFLGSTCNNNLVENCILEDADNAVRAIDGKTITLKYNTFSNNNDAIYSYAETTQIYYNIFKENYTAINISSSLSTTEIYNNVFYDNTVGVSNSYSSLKIYNNIFYLADKGDQAINNRLDNLVSDNNIFYPEQNDFLDIGDEKYSTLYDYQKSLGLDLSSFSSDPLFTDIYNDNFSVEPESPAIDAGRDIGITVDFSGYQVPYGIKTDIGISESMLENRDFLISTGFADNAVSDEPYVYPNPSDGKFNVFFNDMNCFISEIHIRDISGRLIYRKHIDLDNDYNPIDVDISSLPNGTYLVFMITYDKIYKESFVKN